MLFGWNNEIILTFFKSSGFVARTITYLSIILFKSVLNRMETSYCL